MNGYYKTSDGKVVELVTNMFIVSCWDDQLKELIIPDGCGFVLVDMKSVTELNKVKNLNLLV